ncbi:hypothetical protein ONZ45_g14222 [Pleurotus djamor]|nr:hypothetical protein ONZ45_g14222 [Pleurotus djamor]
MFAAAANNNNDNAHASTSQAVALPLPASTRTTSTPSNPVNNFFGGSTRQSRHDRRLSASSIDDVDEALPSYQDVEALPLPAYSESGHREPVTLAMYLFKFGFLFPPFWILGALILVSDLSTPTNDDEDNLSWLPDKTEAEREAIMQKMRSTELKWARRCLCALFVLCSLLLAGGLAIWMVLKS